MARMGFFDWFRRRPSIPVAFWLDEDSRIEGLVAQITQDLAEGQNVVVVAHFDDSLVATGLYLAEAGIPFSTHEQWGHAERQRLLSAPNKVRLVLARNLPEVASGGKAVKGATYGVSFRLVELHVLDAENEHVLAYALSLPGSRIEAGISFEDPLARQFSKPWVKTMMGSLGLKPGDAIRSPMVSRAMQRAVQKLGKRVGGNEPASSLGEWISRNLSA